MVDALTNLIHSGSIWAIVLTFFVGIVTSFNPCLLSMLPLLIGYIGGYSAKSKVKGLIMSFSFVMGLSITFSLMGLIAASLGLVFGQGIGSFWPYLTGIIALIMGLNLLEVFNLNFPGLKSTTKIVGGYHGAFLLGLAFGFVASPCATPVLAVLLTFTASTGKPLYGGAALFAYGLGQGVPLILIGTFTSMVKGLDRVKPWGDKIKKISGIIMVIFGIYLLINA
ncbi:MAG: cytochrome c biogenesis protein CcdA [Bacillota bacterium]